MNVTPEPAAAPAPVPGSRELIARHAREMFEERGFAATSVRAIAAAAGIDPALVIRYFGSKEELFVHVMGLDEQPGPELDGDPATLGRRLASYALAPEREHVRVIYSTLIRASDFLSVRRSLRETTRTLFIDRLTRRLPGRDAALRAELVAAQLGGIMQAWSTIREELPTDADRERVVELYGRAIQALVDAPAG
jgi:AcrR family transcriptional regulator